MYKTAWQSDEIQFGLFLRFSSSSFMHYIFRVVLLEIDALYCRWTQMYNKAAYRYPWETRTGTESKCSSFQLETHIGSGGYGGLRLHLQFPKGNSEHRQKKKLKRKKMLKYSESIELLCLYLYYWSSRYSLQTTRSTSHTFLSLKLFCKISSNISDPLRFEYTSNRGLPNPECRSIIVQL